MSPGQTGASVPQFRKVMTFLDFSFLMMMTNLSRILVAIEKPQDDDDEDDGDGSGKSKGRTLLFLEDPSSYLGSKDSES